MLNISGSSQWQESCRHLNSAAIHIHADVGTCPKRRVWPPYHRSRSCTSTPLRVCAVRIHRRTSAHLCSGFLFARMSGYGPRRVCRVGEGGGSRSPVPSPVHGMQMSTSQFVPQQLRRSSPLGMFLWHGPLHRMGSAVSAPLDRWRKWPMVHLGRSHRRVDGHDGAVGRVSPSCVSGLWETFFAAWMATFVAACEARLLRPTAADLAALAASAAFARAIIAIAMAHPSATIGLFYRDLGAR